VLTRVLLADENPGVRTKAIDLLMQGGGAQRMTDPATVGALQELLRKEDNNYIRLRTQRALQEVNASPGVY
jgi:HEAT repeat protein